MSFGHMLSHTHKHSSVIYRGQRFGEHVVVSESYKNSSVTVPDPCHPCLHLLSESLCFCVCVCEAISGQSRCWHCVQPPGFCPLICVGQHHCKNDLSTLILK